MKERSLKRCAESLPPNSWNARSTKLLWYVVLTHQPPGDDTISKVISLMQMNNLHFLASDKYNAYLPESVIVYFATSILQFRSRIQTFTKPWQTVWKLDFNCKIKPNLQNANKKLICTKKQLYIAQAKKKSGIEGNRSSLLSIRANQTVMCVSSITQYKV